VFCASLADVFEENPQVDSWRLDLFDLIERATNLEWLLLTKRPENVISMIPLAWSSIPDHVWIGTTVENQAMADKRIPELLRIPARVRFLSCEPLLSKVSLIGQWRPGEYSFAHVNWVIVGGESGPKARLMDPDWVWLLREECQAANIPYFFKQWGGRNKMAMGNLLLGQIVQEFPAAKSH
jgi:protein gp37